MERLWIIILIAIVTNVIGAIGKANQNKKPIKSADRKYNNRGYNYKNPNVMDEANRSFINKQEQQDAMIKQRKENDYNMDHQASFSAEITQRKKEFAEPVQYSNVTETEYSNVADRDEIIDIGLSELQHAIVMTEVLNKPIALRKK